MPHPLLHLLHKRLTAMSGALLLLLHLLLLGASAESPSSSEDVFEVTALFEIAANSTCGGDPPTFFVYDGEVFNCSVGDHPAGFALDDNPNTWWQSSNGDDPVSITLSLGELEVNNIIISATYYFLCTCSLH